MWQFDESAAQFPPPRSEEPAELRRAIVEELADHLSCALRREQLAGGPQAMDSARQRVLTRFGDPAAVARRLWWDALWEKTMLQRIVTTACVVLAAVSCLALLLTWQSLASWQTNSERQAREQRELFEKLLEQSDKQAQANADSLRELQALAAGNQQPSEWNPVELRFVAGSENGTPVAGVRATMRIDYRQESGIPPLSGSSDENGTVVFNRAHYGTYSLHVECPTGEFRYEQLELQPGERFSQTIVCPDPPASFSAVKVRVKWPEDLASHGLWLGFDPAAAQTSVDDEIWRLMSIGRQYVYVNPDGICLAEGSASPNPYSTRGVWRVQDLRPSVTIEHLSEPSAVYWPGEHFQLDHVNVLLLARDDQLSEEARATGGAARMWFYPLRLLCADWAHRIEQGADDEPGTLWLTPTPEAIELVEQGLAEFDALMAGDAEEQGDSGSEAAADTPTAAE